VKILNVNRIDAGIRRMTSLEVVEGAEGFVRKYYGYTAFDEFGNGDADDVGDEFADVLKNVHTIDDLGLRFSEVTFQRMLSLSPNLAKVGVIKLHNTSGELLESFLSSLRMVDKPIEVAFETDEIEYEIRGREPDNLARFLDFAVDSGSFTGKVVVKLGAYCPRRGVRHKEDNWDKFLEDSRKSFFLRVKEIMNVQKKFTFVCNFVKMEKRDGVYMKDYINDD
jgi:hypothetical protein